MVTVPTQIGTGYKDISAYSHFTIALKTDGSLWSWGQLFDGQLGNGVAAPYSNPTSPLLFIYGVAVPTQIGTGYTKIASGFGYSIALKADGSMWSWGHLSSFTGNKTADSLVPIKIGTGFVNIFMGSSTAYAISTDGGLWAWGDNCDIGFVAQNLVTNYCPAPVRVH
jgi:alpha-tubulin suppressor-like RCC1 family protein